MLEVDEDSRLGRELIAGGTRYHAHDVPDEDLTAEFYESACERLHAAGIQQYEISNFARAGFESRHNLKYWTRQPYLGFGVDAHSMLPVNGCARARGTESLRFATTDNYDEFLKAPSTTASSITGAQALEESFFLGLRLNRGVDFAQLRSEFGEVTNAYTPVIDDFLAAGLLKRTDDNLQLTPRGRLLSNEVFARFIREEEATRIG
jgi:oxygen-independent coproporphyrinogen-3 oxidase